MLTWQERQGVGVGDMCVPVSAKPVAAWSKDAASQPLVVWQFAQFVTANAGPEVAWVGLFVCCHFVRWHCEFPQSVGAI